jgi:hypothetical protein
LRIFKVVQKGRVFPKTLLCYILVIFPAILLLYFIHLFGVNVIVGDEWDVVPILKLAATGRLTIFDLLAQHNEHRMPFGYLAVLILARFTRYNTVVEMLFSWVLLCMTALLLFLVFRRKFGGNLGLLAFLPVTLILFSFGQYESILWGFVVQIYLMILGVVAALYLLHTSKQINLRFALSSISAIVASFSLITGLMVWPAGLIQILMSQNERKWRKALVWVLVGVVTCTFYFYGWVKPAYEPPLDFVLRNPMAAGEYFLALIGTVFMYGDITSSPLRQIAITYGLVISLVTTLILIHAYRGRLLRKNSIWLSLVAFAFLASLTETLGRSGFGLWQALQASRYTPVTALGIIGIYLLSLSIYRSNVGGRRSRSFGTHALLALFLLGLIFSYNAGWQAGQTTRDSRQMGAYVLLTYKTQSDENILSFLTYNTYPTPEMVRERAQYLDQSKLNVFSEPTINTSTLLPSNSSTLFFLDAINEIRAPQRDVPIVVNASKQQTVTLVGWAVDKQANGAASAVFITVDGKLDIPALYGLDREDVANAFKNPNFRYSGFVASFASSILSKGTHTLSLKIVAADGIHFYYAQQVASLSVS